MVAQRRASSNADEAGTSGGAGGAGPVFRLMRLSLLRRLSLIPALVGGLIALLAVLSLATAHGLLQDFQRIDRTYLDHVLAVDELQARYTAVHIAFHRAVPAGPRPPLSDPVEGLSEQLPSPATLAEVKQRLVAVRYADEVLDRLPRVSRRYETRLRNALLQRASDPIAALAQLPGVESAYRDVMDIFHGLTLLTEDTRQLRLQEAGLDAWRTLLQVFAALLAGAALSLLATRLLLRRLIHPLETITGVTQRLARGDEEVVVPGTDRGDEFGALARALAVFKAAAVLYRRQLRELKQLQDSQADLRRLATTDELCGAANRRHFLERSEQMMTLARRYGRPLAVIMLDVDHFKRINDRYGHHCGDNVLRNLARIGREQLRAYDIFGRMGGEEFALTLPDTDRDAARVVGERLRRAIAATATPCDDWRLQVTASLGVAVLAPGDSRFETLLARADRALYAAKAQGRNCTALAAPGPVSPAAGGPPGKREPADPANNAPSLPQSPHAPPGD